MGSVESMRANERSGASEGRDAAQGPDGAVEHTALRAILDHLMIAVWVVDRRGVYTYHEGQGLTRLGMQPGQRVGHSAFDVLRGDPALDLLRAGLAGRCSHYTVSQADTEWDNWQVPVRDAAGEVTALVGVSLEVTELARTAHELRSKLGVIERQQQEIRELSTPILEVWDRVLTLPIIGLVDHARAADIMESLLDAVTRKRARYAILDLTGVETIDFETAHNLLAVVRTVRMLGAEAILTGIRPAMADTLVALGVELAGLVVRSTLREALQHCIRQMDHGEVRRQAG